MPTLPLPPVAHSATSGAQMAGSVPITGTTSPLGSLKGVQPMHEPPNVLPSTGETQGSGLAIWQSKHLAAPGHLPGYGVKNRKTVADFEERAPIENPSSDRGARFLVGD